MVSVDAQLVAALYEGILDGSALEPAIAMLARRFACNSASIVAFDPLVPQASAALGVGSFDDAARRRYDAEFAVHDPAPRAFAALASGTAVASDRLFPADYLKRSVFLHEFLRPIGIEETLGGKVSAEDGRMAFLTVHRGTDRKSFTEDEIAAFAGLLPYLNRALQLRRKFMRLRTSAQMLGGVIDRLIVGIVVIGMHGEVIHVNRAASAIAARQDGLRFDRNGALQAADRAAARLLTRYRMDVVAGGHGGTFRVPRRDGRQSYAVMVAALPGAAALGSLDGPRAGVLILIHDPDVEASNMTEAIATIFDMPVAAARLVAALMQDNDAKAYAERTGISYETVRYHLKTAFARAGVHSRAALLQQITRALTEFGARK